MGDETCYKAGTSMIHALTGERVIVRAMERNENGFAYWVEPKNKTCYRVAAFELGFETKSKPKSRRDRKDRE